MSRESPAKVKAHVGSRIAQIRKAKGIIQDELAERLDVSNQWLSRLENGHENATIETLVRVANAIGVKVVELFQELDPTDHELATRVLRTARRSRRRPK